MGLASHFAVPAAAIRSIFQSDAPLQPARGFAKTLDQGLGAVQGLQPSLDVAKPRQIGLVGFLAQGGFRILQFPK